MATRKAVAASIASSIIFSSLLVSNFVVYSGAAENFRLVSLATEEQAFRVQAALATGISLLDLIDGAQNLLSSGSFACSNATDSVAQVLSSESVNIGAGSLRSHSTVTLAPDGNSTDDLAGLQPFNGSVDGMTNLEATTLAQGAAPDGSVSYYASEQHFLNIPLRLGSLTGQCLGAEAEFAAAVGGLGGNMCNSTVLPGAASAVAASVSRSAAADGFVVSVSYFVTSAQPCRVGYWISAQQQNIQGPEGAFTFTEEESGYLEA